VCSPCPVGTFNPSSETSACLRCAAGTFRSATGGVSCAQCGACTAGRYRASGCNGVADGVCMTCTSCTDQGTVTALPCSAGADAVCGTAALCEARPKPPMYPWIGNLERCQKGGYLVGYEPSNGTKTCRPCPQGWAGLNGIFCERCGALEEPYFLDRSSCVCRWPAVMNSTGACVCPDGRREEAGECVPCGLNSHGLGGSCQPCAAGTYTSASGATVCIACEYGKFRLPGQAGGCQACALQGWFAPHPGLGECIPCNLTCAMHGWTLDRECPDERAPPGVFSVCKACPQPLPANAVWTRAGECAYNCSQGHYRGINTCEPCSARLCPVGQRLTQCSETADSDCDTECVNASKPAIHSRWENGTDCPWACDDGYELRSWDYVLFQFQECVLSGT
jgi:hypothetical protein